MMGIMAVDRQNMYSEVGKAHHMPIFNLIMTLKFYKELANYFNFFYNAALINLSGC